MEVGPLLNRPKSYGDQCMDPLYRYKGFYPALHGFLCRTRDEELHAQRAGTSPISSVVVIIRGPRFITEPLIKK